MANLEILHQGRGSVHLTRSTNIAASQRANRESFRKANDSLDRFCRDTGFQYSVFIEHALGRGEATRQRFVRSGGKAIQFVGADLEDAAIDAAQAERDAGTLPDDMIFVRGADIGRADILLDALAKHGVDSHGSVMMVGNGFHEIRDAHDRLIEVFKAYADTGIVLILLRRQPSPSRINAPPPGTPTTPPFGMFMRSRGRGCDPPSIGSVRRMTHSP